MTYNPAEVTERVLLAAKLLGLNDTELAREIGVKRQFIAKMNSKESDIPSKRAIIFLNHHKEIDPRWLFFNEGEMIVRPNSDGKHSFYISEKGDMQFSSDNGTDKLLEEKYNALLTILREKDNHIRNIEKMIESQNQFIDKLLSKA